MRILFDRNVEPKFIQAIDQEPWTTTDPVDNHFPQTADDSDLADFAEANDWVLFTRDEPFFGRSKRRNCGFILLHQKRNPRPGAVVDTLRQIRDTYSDYSNIYEGVP
jgi:predicted nuclease of predicted toxin-antitoxin system